MLTPPVHQSRKERLKEARDQAKIDLERQWTQVAQQAMIDARRLPKAPMPIDAAAALADIHPTHNLRTLRNGAFCGVCGYWHIKRARGLAQPCSGDVRPGQASKLLRLNSGLHPDGHSWPDGAPGNVPFPVFRTSLIDGRLHVHLA